MTLRILIVDDEPLARRKLRRLLQGASDARIVRECGDGPSAIAAIDELAPDLVFLDIQLPGTDGFGVLAACHSAPVPEVIFVTAYDRFAIRAFDHHALDYLLKPVSAARFGVALEQARRRLASRRNAPRERQVHSLLTDRGGLRFASRLLVRERERAYFVPTRTIESLEADGNYVVAFADGRASRVRIPLTALAERLDPDRFRRISRSCVVNLDHVSEIQPWFHGDGVVVLRSERQLRLSRRYRDRLFEA